MLKERVENYLKEDERSISYLASKIDISRNTISLFLRDKRELAEEVEDRMVEFLEQKGY